MRLQRAVQGLNYVPNQYAGAGAPSATTLAAGLYSVGDFYLNTTASTLYICITAGSASTSVWAQVGATTTTTTMAVVAEAGLIAVSNSTVETTVISFTDPGNDINVGSMFYFRGHISLTASGVAATLTVRLYVGTTVYVSDAISAALGNNFANVIEVWIHIESIGTGGAFTVIYNRISDSVNQTLTPPVSPATDTVSEAATLVGQTINTTVANTLKVTFQQSVANPSNSSAVRGAQIQKWT